LSQFEKLYKPSFVIHWGERVYFKTSLLTKIASLLAKNKIYDVDIWAEIMDSVTTYTRIYNIEDIHQLLQSYLILHEDPESPFFQLIEREIEDLKSRIKTNPNKSWKYDVDVYIFSITVSRKIGFEHIMKC